MIFTYIILNNLISIKKDKNLYLIICTDIVIHFKIMHTNKAILFSDLCV